MGRGQGEALSGLFGRALLWWRINPVAAAVIRNVGWLTLDRGARVILGILVTAVFARHVGPGLFGLTNYAGALLALFTPLVHVGLSALLVRDFVDDASKAGPVMGTAAAIKFAAAVPGFALILAASRFGPADPRLHPILLVTALAVFAQPFSVCQSWFEARMLSKYTALSSLAPAVLRAAAFVGLALAGQGVMAFVAVQTLAAGLNAILLCLFCARAGMGWTRWRVQGATARSLLSRGWLLALSSWGATVNLKIDQVMLGRMASEHELGLYSAAVRVSEVIYFLPVFIAASAFPVLAAERTRSRAEYVRKYQSLFDVLTWSAVPFALVASLLARHAVAVLFGPAYAASAAILAVHIWACVFVFVGEGLSKWLISEDLLVFSPIRHLIGGAVNVVLNWVLIPRHGGMGAAVATVISYAVSAYLTCYLYGGTREVARIMTRSLAAPVRWLAAARRGSG